MDSDIKTIQLEEFFDSDGMLLFGEISNGLPFRIKRFFCITDVPAGEYRGNHACENACLLLVVLKGSVILEIDDIAHQGKFELRKSSKVIYIPRMVWIRVAFHTEDTILLVLSDQTYKDAGYINDYSEYMQRKGDDE